MRGLFPGQRTPFCLGVGTALLLLCVGTTATAAENPAAIQLIWTAPAGCPSTEEILEKVEVILGRSLDAVEETHHVRGIVTSSEQQKAWHVRLETDTRQGRAIRELDAASCSELADVTALFLAILVEPQERQPESEEQEEEPSAAPVAHSEKMPTMWSLGAAMGMTRGLLPQWAPGVNVRGGVSWKALFTRVGVSLWAPTKITLEGDEGASFRLLTFPVELCAQRRWGKFSPALCAGVRIARLRGKGFGPSVSGESRTITLLSGSAGGEVSYHYSKKGALFLGGSAVVPFDNRQFVFDGTEPTVVFSPGVGAELFVGTQFSF